MMTVHKITSGDGYEYLTRQVAANDATNRGRDALADYYSEKGERPGEWIGSVNAAAGVLGRVSEAQMRALYGEGRHPEADRIGSGVIAAGGSVTQAMAATALGRKFPEYAPESTFLRRCAEAFRDLNLAEGRRWNAALPDEVRAGVRTSIGRELFAAQFGRAPMGDHELHGFIAQQSRPAVVACAGFDLTFTPPKSVSALWAVAPREVAERVERAHRESVRDALRWFERHAAFTRSGAGGVRKLDTTGVWAAEFVHRDSRSGDPNLHSHVVVSAKVRGPDGAWRALDGTVVFKSGVAMSERYNTLMETRLRALGLRFYERSMGAGKRPVREVEGLPRALCDQWSSRSQSIRSRQAQLAVQFRARHGRAPTPIEEIGLAQQANLDTRAGKHEPRSLAEQRAAWRVQAESVVGGPDRLAAVVRSALSPAPAPGRDADVAGLVAAVAGRVEEARSKWQVWHVRAEAERQVRSAVAHLGQVDRLVDEVTAAVLAGSQRLGPADPAVGLTPVELRGRDRDSVYGTPGAALYTSVGVLAAEQRIIAAAARRDGRTASDADVEIAGLEWSANHGGLALNAGQAAMVRDMATSGARVQLALAPAGSGKTTAMGVLAGAWENSGGTVVAFSTTAGAAQELADALGVQQGRTLALLETQLAKPARARQGWVNAVGPGSLLIVDEAGMASTAHLDLTVRYALARGASVRLVGDEQQLASVTAGGVLRDLHAEYGAVTLTELVRFRDPGEGVASLALRAGDPAALGHYLDRGRVHAGDATTTVDDALDRWRQARADGLDALMLAARQETVTEMNRRAQMARRAGQPVPGRVAVLADGLHAAAGDVVITRRNAYPLAVTETDFVKNGDRWVVERVHERGMDVHRLNDRRVRITLPPRYVADHTRLGYAATVHSAQGVTTDVCVAVVDDSMDRALLYVALSRGRVENHAMVQVAGDGDPHTIIRPEVRSPQSAAETLARVLGREPENTSATSADAALRDPVLLLGEASAAYADALGVAARAVLGPERLHALTVSAEGVAPGVTGSGAWDTLGAHLALVALDGDPAARLLAARDERELGSALDPAAVLDWRLDRTGNHSQGEGPLPWLPALPARLAGHESWGPYLTARARQVADLRRQVLAVSDRWTPSTCPGWARPYLADRGLVNALALWRASWQVDPADARPTGPRPARLALSHRASELDRAAVRVGGRQSEAGDRWAAVLPDGARRIVADPYWPVLAARLNTADAAGLPVLDMLRAAIGEGPLPVEYAAEAVWFRLAGHMAPTAGERPAGTVTARPPWTATLAAALGPGRAEAVIGDSAWPALVARVDHAVRDGLDPDRLVGEAAGAVAAHLDSLTASEVPTALLWHVSLLADPEPYLFAPPDPADADQVPPTDAHELGWAVDAAPGVAAAVPGEVQPPFDPDYDLAVDPEEEAARSVWADAGLAREPEDDLPPVERLASLRVRLDAARAAWAALDAQVNTVTAGGAVIDGGPRYLAALPAIQAAHRRADALAPLVADATWWCREYIDADRSAETAAQDVAAAERAVTAAAASGAPEWEVDTLTAEAATARVVAAGAASARAEQYDRWQDAEAALTAGSGGQPVTTWEDVEALRDEAITADQAVLGALRVELQRLEGAVFRADNAARRAVPAPAAATSRPVPPAQRAVDTGREIDFD